MTGMEHCKKFQHVLWIEPAKFVQTTRRFPTQKKTRFQEFTFDSIKKLTTYQSTPATFFQTYSHLTPLCAESNRFPMKTLGA